MIVNFQKFASILKEKEEKNQITRDEANILRSNVTTLSMPKCPPKLKLALAHKVNIQLGEAVVQINS